MELYKLSPLSLGEKIRNKELTPTEAANYFLQRSEKLNPEIKAFISLTSEAAQAGGVQVERAMEAGECSSPLAGVPYGIKDNICTKGLETTCASKILGGFKPPYNATIVEKLDKAGCVIIGKTNMDEFAMGSTTETSYSGITANPWNTQHVPGGSSGGSAAAVAAGMVPFAIGSDTGGSIRQPASYCGVTGMKPTYGAVSRFGLIAYGSSLDQIGPLAGSAKDCAVVLDIIMGKDERDTTSMAMETSMSANIDRGIKGLKIGIPNSYMGEGLDPEVKEAIMTAAKVLADNGAEIEELDLDMVEYAVPAYYIIASAEASSNLSRYDGVKYGYRSENAEGLRDIYLKSRTEGFGSEVKKRIMLGAFALSSGYYDAYYNKALQVKALIKKAFDEAFNKYDLILGPVAPTTAPRIGDSLKDPLKMYLSDIYTVSVNLAGLPGISLPCGFDKNGLPIGMQFIGKAFNDAVLLQAAGGYQQLTDFHLKHPAAPKKGGE